MALPYRRSACVRWARLDAAAHALFDCGEMTAELYRQIMTSAPKPCEPSNGCTVCNRQPAGKVT